MGVQREFLVFLGDEESLERGAIPVLTLKLASGVQHLCGEQGVIP